MDTLLRGTSHTRNGENGSNTAAYKVGIIEIRERITNDDCISFGSISTAQDGSKVARLLHTFKHNDKRIIPKL